MARSIPNAVLCCVLAVGLLAATGCLVAHVSSVSETGSAVASGKLESIEEGVTTRDDVVRAFGAPKQTVKLADGGEVLTYVYERKREGGTSIIFLLMWKTEKRQLVRYSFEFQDGLLVRHWVEDLS